MSEDIRQYLQECAASYGIAVSDGQAEQFQWYMELLIEWNEKMNLTAITEPKAVVVKHFLDSILLLPELEQGDTLIDVGTGAGFPGVPLKIGEPSIRLTLLDSLGLHLTLLDSLNKRLIFLREVLDRLGLDAQIVHARAEEGGRQAGLRTKFAFATARAVAPLNLLCEYCLPFLQMGGVFLAMKGPEPDAEVEAAKRAVSRSMSAPVRASCASPCASTSAKRRGMITSSPRGMRTVSPLTVTTLSSL